MAAAWCGLVCLLSVALCAGQAAAGQVAAATTVTGQAGAPGAVGGGASLQPQSSGGPGASPSQPPGRPGGTKPLSPAARKALLAKKSEPLELFPLLVAWRQALGSPAAVAPGFDDDTAYIPLKTGALVALSLRDGTPRYTLESTPVTMPPIVDKGRLYLIGDGTLAAREAATGKPLWHVPLGGPVSAQPVADNGWLILAYDNGDVHALKGENGESVWKVELGASVRTEPLIFGDRLYLAPEGSALRAMELLTGKPIWERDLGATVNSISAHGSMICAGTAGRMLYGVEEKRGEVKWKWRIGGDVIGRPAFDEAMAYVLLMDNTMRAFALRDGDQKWREALTFRPLSGPLRLDGTLFVASFSPAVRGYRVKDGKRAGAFSLPISERSAPAAPPHLMKGAIFIDDAIVMLTLDGEVITLRRMTMGPIMPLVTVPGTAVPAPVPPDPIGPPSATASLPRL